MALRRLRRSSISDGTTSSVLRLCVHVYELFIMIIKNRVLLGFFIGSAVRTGAHACAVILLDVLRSRDYYSGVTYQ